MAIFPTLTPSSRTFTPGVYPHTALRTLNSFMSRVRSSNVMLGSQLRLTFVAITEAQMLTILSHYNTQRGGFESFWLPLDIWSGVSSTDDYQLAGYGWIYTEPPVVTDAMCADAYDVELALASVPPEGTALLGLDQRVVVTLAAGVGFASNSVTMTVLWSLVGGGAGLPALDATVTWSLAAGAATGGGAAAGLGLIITADLEKGPDAIGINVAVPWSLAAGTAGDVDFASVSLLLHMDGANNSTTFTDSSSAALTISRYGDAKISTAQSKFGGASGYFDGAGDYLTCPVTSGAFNMGTGDFTMEAWIRIASTSGNKSICGLWPRDSDGSFRFVVVNNTLSFTLGTTAAIKSVTSSACLSANTWHYVAVVRNGSDVTIYCDGGSVGTMNLGTGSTSLTVRGASLSTTGLQIGRNEAGNTWFMNGYIDDLRITKGVARDVSTNPASAFPDS